MPKQRFTFTSINEYIYYLLQKEPADLKSYLYLKFGVLLCLCTINCSKTVSPDLEGDKPQYENIIEPSTQTHDKRPNILLVIADDFGVDPVPRYPFGETKAVMPTLERLMDSSIRFTNVWTNPICSPTRAAILTGKYGFRTGVLNAEEAGRINVNEKTLHSKLNELTDSPYLIPLGTRNNNMLFIFYK